MGELIEVLIARTEDGLLDRNGELYRRLAR
jgi:hypothetical protein